MDFSNLSVEHIVVLIEGGIITQIEDIISAHNQILRRIIFHNEVVDKQFFEKLSYVVKVLQAYRSTGVINLLPPPSYEQAVANGKYPVQQNSRGLPSNSNVPLHAQISQNGTNSWTLPSFPEGVASTSRSIPVAGLLRVPKPVPTNRNMKHVFKCDHVYQTVITESTVNPTDVLKTDAPWIYAQNDKYPINQIDPSKIGKWMIFPSKQDVNLVWNKVKEAIRLGELWHSKVSTSDHSNNAHAIMIYTKDYTDIDNVIQTLDYLEFSGIKPPFQTIYYKTDQQTYAGIYSGGTQRASIYASNTIRGMRGQPGIRTLLTSDGANSSKT